MTHVEVRMTITRQKDHFEEKIPREKIKERTTIATKRDLSRSHLLVGPNDLKKESPTDTRPSKNHGPTKKVRVAAKKQVDLP